MRLSHIRLSSFLPLLWCWCWWSINVSSIQAFLISRPSAVATPPQITLSTTTTTTTPTPTPSTWRLQMSAAETTDLPPVQSMRAGEIKKELESYGISTVSFLEKSELVDALTKARAQGLKPKSTTTTSSTSSQSSSSSSRTSPGSTTSASSSSSDTTTPRNERIKQEMEKCQAMKTSELKKELQERGISTKSFFEKSEFVRALAEARVDNITQQQSKSSAGNSGSEGYAEYKNVEVLTDDSAGPRPKKTEQQQQPSGGGASNPFGGANPFGGGGGGGGGGGASPFGGGMGGMGGIADLLKNMGVGGMAGGSPFGGAAGANPFGGAAGANPFGGAAGANPFGGAAGANPFGGGGGGGVDPNMFARAQKMMSNPKVQQIIAKAQSNPRIMAKVNECMSNPASFMKYRNDPDVSELIQELQKYM